MISTSTQYGVSRGSLLISAMLFHLETVSRHPAFSSAFVS